MVGFGVDVDEEAPDTSAGAARLRNALRIFLPAVRITAREAGNKDFTMGRPGISSDDKRTTRGFSVRSSSAATMASAHRSAADVLLISSHKTSAAPARNRAEARRS